MWAVCLAAVFSTTGLCRPDEATVEKHAAGRAKEIVAYEGRWWASAEREERTGFLIGVADCWSDADLQGPRGGDLEDVDKAISKHYESHPRDQTLSIVEAWAKVEAYLPVRTHPEDGERYRHPHGFLDGNWYKQGSYPERIGYLQGYLGCLQTYLNDPPQKYSRSVGYYDDHVWDHVASSRNGENEAVAVILSRFRDRTDGKRGPLPPIRRKYPYYVSPEFPVQKDWRFDGHWWLDNAESPERLGFVQGAQDYLTWIAHDETFSSWPVQVVSAINAYYKAHTDDQNALVLNAWRMLAPQIPLPTPAQRRDRWNQKPKGRYLGNIWWSTERTWLVPPDEREGFLEAYIWCLLNYSDQTTETYSSSPYDYEEKIGNYLMAHPKAVNEPLANLLYLFRDKPKVN